MKLDVRLVSANAKCLIAFLNVPHINLNTSTIQMVVQNVNVTVLMLTVMHNVVGKDLVLLSERILQDVFPAVVVKKYLAKVNCHKNLRKR